MKSGTLLLWASFDISRWIKQLEKGFNKCPFYICGLVMTWKKGWQENASRTIRRIVLIFWKTLQLKFLGMFIYFWCCDCDQAFWLLILRAFPCFPCNFHNFECFINCLFFLVAKGDIFAGNFSPQNQDLWSGHEYQISKPGLSMTDGNWGQKTVKSVNYGVGIFVRQRAGLEGKLVNY